MNLFDNIFQKTAWIVYIILSVVVFALVDTYNTNTHACTGLGNCLDMLSYISALTLIFIVVAIMLRKKKKTSKSR
jgi:hypothetical protein